MILVLVIVIVGLFSNWVVTPSIDISESSLFGISSVNSLKIFNPNDLTVKNQLNFMDGLKNGVRTCSSFFAGVLYIAYSLYIELFPHEMIWKVVWAIFGIPLSLMGAVVVFLFGVIPIIINRLLLVPLDWSYYVGFLSICIIFVGLLAIVSKDEVQDRSAQV